MERGNEDKNQTGLDKIVRRPTADYSDAAEDHFGGYDKFVGGQYRLRNTSIHRRAVPFGFSKKLPEAKQEGDLLDVLSSWAEPSGRYVDGDAVRMDGNLLVNLSSIKKEPVEENTEYLHYEAIRQDLHHDIEQEEVALNLKEEDTSAVDVKNITREIENTDIGTSGQSADNSMIIAGPSCSTAIAGSGGMVTFRPDVSIIPGPGLTPVTEEEVTPGGSVSMAEQGVKPKVKRGRKNKYPRKLSSKKGVAKKVYRVSPFPWTKLTRAIYEKMEFTVGAYSLPKSDKEGGLICLSDF